MATTYGSTGTAAKASSGSWDQSLWYDSRWYKFGMGLMLAVACFWIWYQQTFAYSHGMDSMEPEFEKVSQARAQEPLARAQDQGPNGVFV